MTFLTKSLYLTGLQCPKYLWTGANRPEAIPEADAGTRHLFSQGNLVDQLSKTLFASGIDIPHDDFEANIRLTKEKLASRKPLFQAGFLADNLFARTDILNPSQNGKWDLIEVKSSTTVKDIHTHDVAFQKTCCELSGIRINRCFIMHVNTAYIREGGLKPQEFFTCKEITDNVERILDTILPETKRMLPVIRKMACPKVQIGEHCNYPFDCQLKAECFKFLPGHNPLTLYRLKKSAAFELIHRGILSIKRLPSPFKLSYNQKIQVEATKNRKPYINKRKIGIFLEKLVYPLSFLDFETFETAIPLYDGTKPYQKLTFQYSLHTVAEQGAQPAHFSFLGNGKDDPRPEFIKSLRENLPDTGSIIVYNRSFEKTMLENLAVFQPSCKRWVNRVTARLTDLLVPFQSFSYYDPEQRGSASIKRVLPALTGRNYNDLEIGDGMTASLEYLFITLSNLHNTDADEKTVSRIRENLLEYCSLDTEAMILILRKLHEVAGN
ncbi:MAG: DUF2779 domain-containing protein [Spirochaetales bacterium]|nr:DUF2779 domain-containing protein [Spirochaetales bacterium]